MGTLLQLQQHYTRHVRNVALFLVVASVGCSGETGILSGANNTDTGLSEASSDTGSTISVTTTSTQEQANLYFTIQGALQIFDDDIVSEVSALTISLYDDNVLRCTSTFEIEKVVSGDPIPNESLLGWWQVSTLGSVDEYCAVPPISLFLGIGDLPVSVEPQVAAQGIGENALQGLFFGRTAQELWAIGAALPPDSGGIMGVLQNGSYELTTLYLIPW